ncbi:MAG TPA: serine/threonine-protein kinase [Polyangiales bacterium]|nr:serine/threonine-protein kinase [Polyangiales bacterium]
MTDAKLERLRRTLTAQGVSLDASASNTLTPQRKHALDDQQALLAPAPEEVDPDYTLRGPLGLGGMAVVWLAQQQPLARDVAIKCQREPEDADASLLLLREAMITGQLEHPNIVPVHALIGVRNSPAVVMKRLAGKTWDVVIAAGELTLDRHLEIFAQVLNAVAFAHSRGVFHRDIKPGNVMIGEFGEVTLLDWGVAQRIDDPPSDAIVGTPRYLAPEMAEGQVDARTDVFLLGGTLHEVLTGEPRHRGESPLEVLYAAMNVEPYAYEGVPEELAAICNRACARAPGDRFQSANELREALAAFREHRAAGILSAAAEAQLERLQAAADDRSVRNAEVQQLFVQARFGFEAALRQWPASPEALAGLTRCLCVMIDYELNCRRPEAAAALLGALPSPDGARLARVKQLEAELGHEQARLHAMERDRDPRVGAPDRTRAYRMIAIATLFLTTGLTVQRLWANGLSPPSTGRLALVGAFVLLIMAAILAWWRRRGSWNFINRRIAEIALSTVAVSFASRLAGYLLGARAEQVLVTDALILGLGGAAMAAYHRAGPWLAGVSFSVALVGSLWPSAVDELFILLSVFLPLLFLSLRRVERIAS